MRSRILSAITAFIARIFSIFRHHKEETTMKVDNTPLDAQIGDTKTAILGLLDKLKAAVAEAATNADLQAQVASLTINLAAAQASLDSANTINAGLTADLAASQQESTDLAAKLKAVSDLAAGA